MILSTEKAIELVEEYIGPVEISGEHYIKTLCPLHEEKHPSFWVNLELLTCGCFTGCYRGPLWKLLRHLKVGKSVTEFVQKCTVEPPKRITHYRSHDPLEATFGLPDSVLASFDYPIPPFVPAGLGEEVPEDFLRAHDVGFDIKNKWTTYGVRDVYGTLAGVSARTEDPVNKYRFYKKTFRSVFGDYEIDKSRHLWNGHLVDEELRSSPRDTPVILVEGFKAGLYLLYLGLTTTVACMGATPSLYQLETLELWGHPVILFLDFDAAGRKGVKNAGWKLREKKVPTFIASYPEEAEFGWQPDDLTPEEVEHGIINAARYKQRRKPRRDQWQS